MRKYRKAPPCYFLLCDMRFRLPEIAHNQWRKRGHFQVQRQRAPLVGLDKKRGKQNGARLTGMNVRVLETERSRARVAYRSNAELWRFYALVFVVKF